MIERFAGRFALLQHLGRGGMGDVYLARDLSTGGECALKRLHRGATRETAMQIEVEFRVLTRVSHPAVVRVFELGFSPDGRPFFTMEYVPGLPADRAIRRDDRPALGLAAVQLAHALEALHAAGIVHGDLKPSNVLVVPGADPAGPPAGVRVLDFGLAHLQQDPALRHTGTPGYAAPEVVRGEAPGIASDLYGLGATLYHLASGHRPFEAESTSGVLRLQQQGTPPTAPLEDAGVAKPLQRLILRLMSPTPAERGDRASEIRHELERLFPSAIRPLTERIAAGRPIGRERELARLENWLAEPVARARLEIVTAGAGEGASALLDELAARAGIRRRRVIRLSGLGAPGAAARALLRRLIAEDEAAPAPERASEWLAANDAPLGEEDLSELTEIALGRLAGESEGSATLVLVDDSAALDAPTRALLRRLLLAPAGGIRRMVWAQRGTKRGLPEDERALLDAGLAHCIELRPLSREDVARLASARLGAPAPESLVEWLWSRAAGHPGFTLELMRHAAAAGAIADDEIGVRVDAAQLESLAAPPTLEAALLARWALLDTEARSLGVTLAALARPVSPDELLAIEPRADRDAIERLLAAGLIAHDDAGALALRPPALASAMLESLDAAARMTLHESILHSGRIGAAERFEHLSALGRGAEALAAAEIAFAEHPDERLALAAAERSEKISPVEAARWYERAGRLLFDRSRHAESVPLFDRALELDPNGPDRHERREALAHALFRVGSFDRLERLVSEALGDDPPGLVRAGLLETSAVAHQKSGRLNESEGDYRRAIECADQEEGDVESATIRMSLAGTLILLGRLDEAEATARAAIEFYRRANNERGVLRTEGTLASIDMRKGRFGDSERAYSNALQVARARGERLVIQEFLQQRGVVCMLLGRWREAGEQTAEALQIALEDGRASNAAFLMTTRALLEGLSGRVRSALRDGRAAYRMASGSYRAIRGVALRDIAQAYRACGMLNHAERAIRRGLSLPETLPEELEWGRIELARILFQAGRHSEARGLLRVAEEGKAVTAPSAAIRAAMAGRVALRLGEFEAAERSLESLSMWRQGRAMPYYAAHELQLRAELALVLGRFEEGARAARDTLETYASLPDPMDRANAALEFARLAQSEESDERVPVTRWLEEAAAGFQRLGDRRGREAALALLVRRLKRMTAQGAVPARAQDLIAAVRRLLDSLSDLRELAQRSMQLVVEQLDAERGVLLLMDEKGGRLVEHAEHGAVDAETRRSAASYSRRVVERVAESGGVVLIGDAGSDPRGGSESIMDLRLQSILCVPMYVGGRVVGAVYLDSRRPDAFTESDRALLEGFAQLMAVAFEKSRGQQEVERVNRQLVGENIQLRVQAGVRFRMQNLVAVSSEMQRVLAVVERVAHSDATVLLTGENGTGKELIALTLHHAGRRRERPFVAVNCGAIPAGLLESELFGILPRVATDVAAREGRFVQANGGTLFLDEITEMPAQQQVALLRVLSTREVTPVGGGTSIAIDVRIIAASNRDIVRMVDGGTFREDLYHRLNVIPIEIPPLRERKADIPALAEHFARHFAEQQQRPTPQLSPELLAVLMQSDWPGNVRALQNYIERIMAMSPEPVLFPNPLPRDLQAAPGVRLHGRKLSSQVEELEQRLINEALRRTGGNQSVAARELGLTEQSMRYRLRKYALGEARRKQRIRR